MKYLTLLLCLALGIAQNLFAKSAEGLRAPEGRPVRVAFEKT